jgi:type II secretory pathway pseudopilin PulG
MEPVATVRRAPNGVLQLALLADLAAIAYLTVAFAGFTSHPSTTAIAVFAALAAYGLVRLLTAYGLRHLAPYGAALERASAFIWIALSAIIVIWARDAEAIPWCIPGIIVSVVAFVYLRRPATRALFAGPPLPMTPSAAFGLAAIGAIVAILAGAVAPRFMHGGTQQKRTMADMRTIATAWEARATDLNRYNAAAIAFPTTGVTIDNLVTYLTPTYVKEFPVHDGWGNSWQFGIDQPWGSNEPAQTYAIISYGKDGKPQRKWDGGPTTNFDCDIVYSNGAFLQYPEGVQQQ